MKPTFYRKLQADFTTIRDLHSGNIFDEKKYNLAIFYIRDAREKIVKHSSPYEKKILLYCIDTLFEILKENNSEKIFDFAHAIHDIPQIYAQERNLFSFRRELKTFQKKYGKEYFAFIDQVEPYFSKKAPKNKREFFSRKSDEEFKQLHPIGYWFLVAIGITVLMLPEAVYISYITFLNPPQNDSIIVLLGLAGSFTIGIGFFNIVAAWIHQYLGHLLTIICFIGGLALTLISIGLLHL
jgi:hypothetical protein